MMKKQSLNNELRTGNTAAFTILFKTVYPRLVAYCKLFVLDDNVAHDLAQDCFLKLWEERNKIDKQKPVESLLFVMIRNRCLNYLRDKKKLIRIPFAEEWDDLQYLYQIDFLEDEEIALENKRLETLMTVLDGLPAKRKEIFIRCKLNGEKQKIVAQDLGLSVKSIEKHIRLSKEELRKKLSIASK